MWEAYALDELIVRLIEAAPETEPYRDRLDQGRYSATFDELVVAIAPRLGLMVSAPLSAEARMAVVRGVRDLLPPLPRAAWPDDPDPRPSRPPTTDATYHRAAEALAAAADEVLQGPSSDRAHALVDLRNALHAFEAVAIELHRPANVERLLLDAARTPGISPSGPVP